MKWFVYNVLFAIAYTVMMPSFLLRMKRRGGYKARMGDRFGRYPDDIVRAIEQSNKDFVWIHAVSVGEVQVAGQLMRALRERDPKIRFVFSTTSSTGWKTAEREVTPADVLIYNPLDFGGCVKRALDLVNPRAVILTETEIWPNFIRALKKRGIPVYLVNARISDHSAPRYRKLRWFFGEVFRCFAKIYAQSDLDAQRLIDAGADPASVAVTGSFKFDVAHRSPAKESELLSWITQSNNPNNQTISQSNNSPILLGGSTWPGEDVVLLNAYRKLLAKHPDVKLVIAPRHFEKADAVEANIVSAGFSCVRRSRQLKAAQSPQSEQSLNLNNRTISQSEQSLNLNNRTISQSEQSNNPNNQTIEQSPAVYLADTTGELMGLFGISTVAFVGKSLCEHGSQNMIEPCLCGVATVVGPYTENFRPVMSDLLAADALVQTPDAPTAEARADAVVAAILRLFDDEAERRALGARAQAAVVRRCGVVGRCADELLEALK